MADSVTHGHISEPNADLRSLRLSALRRYGDGAAYSADGEVASMFIEFANMIVDEVRAHPYYNDALEAGKMPELKYYTSDTEQRPIPDAIMIAGLLYHYAVQQASATKVQIYMPAYARAMNQHLLRIAHGFTRYETTNLDKGPNGYTNSQ
jgi:hypothetical protein